MVYGIGIDILSVNKVLEPIKRNGITYLDFIFTKKELNQMKDKDEYFYAVIFSFKEALWKSLDIGWTDGYKWDDITVLFHRTITFELKGKTLVRSKILNILKFEGKYYYFNSKVLTYVYALRESVKDSNYVLEER